MAGGLVGVSFSGDTAELNLFFPYTCISGARWREEAESIPLKKLQEGFMEVMHCRSKNILGSPTFPPIAFFPRWTCDIKSLRFPSE